MNEKVIAALEKKKAEVLAHRVEFGWTPKDKAWHRAFGRLCGINYALDLLQNRPVSPSERTD